MCGIVAFYDPKINDKQAVIGKMMATIKHRGPSSDGYYTNDEVALGFRRLSIIDLRGGTQPIYNEDKTRAIIFNFCFAFAFHANNIHSVDIPT